MSRRRFIVGASLIFPFRALWRGHIFMLAFTAFFGFAAWTLFDALNSIGVALITRFDRDSDILKIAAPYLYWLLSVPFFLVAFCLPLRDIWYNGRLRSSIISDIEITLRKVTTALLVLLFATTIYLAIPTTLYISYVSYRQRFPETAGANLLFLIFTFLSLSLSTKTWLSYLITPLVACTSHFSGTQSINTAAHLLQGRRIALVILLLLFTLVMYALLGMEIITNYKLAVVLGTIWYFMTALGGFALMTIEETTREQLSLVLNRSDRKEARLSDQVEKITTLDRSRQFAAVFSASEVKELVRRPTTSIPTARSHRITSELSDDERRTLIGR